jgi:YlmC/YmxH family sporulation protein
MICSLSELKQKEIIDITDGTKIGFVDDVEMDLETSSVTSLVVYGRPRFFGLLGRDEDMIIRCEEISVVGKDTILIKPQKPSVITKKTSFSMESLCK